MKTHPTITENEKGSVIFLPKLFTQIKYLICSIFVNTKLWEAITPKQTFPFQRIDT